MPMIRSFTIAKHHGLIALAAFFFIYIYFSHIDLNTDGAKWNIPTPKLSNLSNILLEAWDNQSVLWNYVYYCNSSSTTSSNNFSLVIANFTDGTRLCAPSTAVSRILLDISERYVMHDRPAHYDALFKSTYSSYSRLPRRMILATYKNSFVLLQNFTDLLKRHGIPFCLTSGTLLGSYFFHNMIPWDDDLDLYVDFGYINKLRSMFATQEFQQYFLVHSIWDTVNIYNNTILNQAIPASKLEQRKCPGVDKSCNFVGKISSRYGHDIPNFPWKFPFVDFEFFENKSSTVERVEIPQKYNKDDFYPFINRPFHTVSLPTPRRPLRFLKDRYRKFYCSGYHWDHQRENMAYNRFSRKVSCDEIKEVYPYVRRSAILIDGHVLPEITREDLVLEDQILDTVFVNEHYEGPYELTLSGSFRVQVEPGIIVCLVVFASY